jgi:hypothetical protein
MSLFGCAPRRPLDYSGSAGLLWALKGGRLVQLHRDWAVIDVPVNRSERIFYRRNVDVAKIGVPLKFFNAAPLTLKRPRPLPRPAPPTVGLPRR